MRSAASLIEHGLGCSSNRSELDSSLGRKTPRQSEATQHFSSCNHGALSPCSGVIDGLTRLIKARFVRLAQDIEKFTGRGRAQKSLAHLVIL
jgi:hypothetical protein